MERLTLDIETEPALRHLKVFWGGIDGSREPHEPFSLGGGCDNDCLAQGGGGSGDETPACGDAQGGGGCPDGCPPPCTD